jgi:glutamyl-tRNA synthetase
MPTVQGVLRRGLTLAALKEFIVLQGASKNLTTQEWDRIWAINKRMIDPVAPRHTAVLNDGRVPLHLSGGPAPGAPEVAACPLHKKDPSIGAKAVVRAAVVLLDRADAAAVAAEVKAAAKAAAGGGGGQAGAQQQQQQQQPQPQQQHQAEVTLMDWGNAVIESYEVAPVGPGGALAVTALRGRLNLAGDVKRTKLKLTWLPAPDEARAAAEGAAPEAAPLRAAAACAGLVPLRLSDFDYLITKKKVEEDDDFKSLINPRTRRDVDAVGDGNMARLRKGDFLQLERRGFFVVDRAWDAARPDEPAVLLAIPDGRARPPPGEYFEAQARAEVGVAVEAP